MNGTDGTSTRARGADLGWGWKPGPIQTLLAHAALGTGQGTIESAQLASSRCAIAELDRGSRRLLPFVYRRLVAEGCDGAALADLRTVHRRSWAAYHRLIVGSQELVAGDGKAVFGPTRTLSSNAINFGRRPDGAQCDVQWRVDFEERRSDERERVERAVPLDTGPVAGLGPTTPESTDMLLHLLVHAMQWNAVSPVRWVVDVALLLRNESHKLDCERSTLRLFSIDFIQRSAGESLLRRVLLFPVFLSRILRRTRQFRLLRPTRRIRSQQ